MSDARKDAEIARLREENAALREALRNIQHNTMPCPGLSLEQAQFKLRVIHDRTTVILAKHQENDA